MVLLMLICSLLDWASKFSYLFQAKLINTNPHLFKWDTHSMKQPMQLC